MSDVFPKYIVEDGNLIIAKCTYHYQLLQDYADKSKCKGGGWWKRGNEKELIFHGDSHDLDKASLESIQECLNAGNVFTDKYQMHNHFEGYTFYYDTGTEIIKLLTPQPTTNE